MAFYVDKTDGGELTFFIIDNDKIADVLRLTDEERAEMFDLAGRERNKAASDLPEYIMDENLPHVRAALSKASDKKLGDDFWQRVLEEIEKKGQVWPKKHISAPLSLECINPNSMIPSKNSRWCCVSGATPSGR